MHQVLPSASTIDQSETLRLYSHMVLAREIDALEERLVNRGQAAFHVSGAGHEALAALAAHLGPQDWLHCHYRDKALMVARGLPTQAFFDNLLCSGASSSRGRQMSAHFSWRPGNVLSLCGPVGNNALQAVGIAAEVRDREGQPIVLCCLGDGTTQQGEVLEAIAEAVRSALPVLFLIENNAWAISTRTRGKTFFSLPTFDPDEFMGVAIDRVDGSDAISCSQTFGSVVRAMRVSRGPGLVVMDVERLANHTHADDQRQYRPAAEMDALARRDPIAYLRATLVADEVDETHLREIEREAFLQAQDAAAAAVAALTLPVPTTQAKRALSSCPQSMGSRVDSAKSGDAHHAPLTMGAALADALRKHLRTDDRVTLFGQDIEDPKGDVFGVTRGLSTEFGTRVENAPLSEATIVGKAIGRALAGGRPVAFLQFADFLPIAFNQIASEMASIHWRTDGEWDCPVILMAPSGGYRQGLGPFHAQSFEATACHVPGLDVLYPSTAADAAGLLDAAFASGRPTLFFYPKALLNDAAVALPNAAVRPVVEIGKAALVRSGADITFVAYGNCVRLCIAAADWLKEAGLSAEIIDLRSLSPLDETAILRSVRKTGRLLVAHEDVGTCGLAAEIMARVGQSIAGVRMGRAVRADTFVPCNFANQLAILPSARSILDEAARLLDIDVAWTNERDESGGTRLVRAAGSPSDETVTMIACHVGPGDPIREGDLLATFETVKAAIEFEAPVSGIVEAVFAAPGDTITVGAPFLSIATGRAGGALSDGLESARPALSPRLRAEAVVTEEPRPTPSCGVDILAVATKLGSNRIHNADLADRHGGRSAKDIDRLTGIAERRQVADGETAVTLGADAARRALDLAALTISDITAVICATGTPGLSTPSLACRILYDLAGRGVECQAHDVSAACSGYLYALQSAYDMLQAKPGGHILLITSEVLTPLVDGDDFETGLLFSDGASATVLGTRAARGDDNQSIRLTLSRPVLSAAGEPGKYLTVPTSRAEGAISMDGNKVFTTAVKSMSEMLLQACAADGCSVRDLDLVVPHQANRRILDAVAARLGVPVAKVASNIRERGNTSSSTIPICLAEHWSTFQAGQKIGLTAFGGGFTYGAALLDVG